MHEHLLASKGTVLHTAKTTTVYAYVCVRAHFVCVCVGMCVCVCVCLVRRKNYLANQKLTFSFKINEGNIVDVSHCVSYFLIA